MVDRRNLLRGAPSSQTQRIVMMVLLSLVCLMGALRLSAETVVGTDLTFQAALIDGVGPTPSLNSVSDGKLTLSSRGSEQIKGSIELEVLASDAVQIAINKVFLKARLGDVRLTMGKTRLSWGEGVLFNAGDVIFGGDGVDLSAEDIHSATKWLVSLYFPLGDYSFLELVGLPPDLPLNDFLNGKKPDLQGPEKTSYGGRAYGKLGDVKIEGGYLFNGTKSVHKPYLSFQGNLLADWELSSSVELDAVDMFNWGNMATWEISGGVYYQIPIAAETGDAELTETPSSGTLNLRMEARVRPYGQWDTSLLPPRSFNPLLSTDINSTYALSLYPEISFKSDTWFVFGRSIISPLDASALTTVGAQWAPLQGFKILAGFTWQMGEMGDSYVWNQAGGWQVSLGTNLTF